MGLLVVEKLSSSLMEWMFLVEGDRYYQFARLYLAICKNRSCCGGLSSYSDGHIVVKTSHEECLLFSNLITVESAGPVVGLVCVFPDT